MRGLFSKYRQKPDFDFDNISRERNFVFIHVPKNAGTSICKLLNLNLSRHYTLREYKQILGSKQYHAFYSFAVVRNPFSRFLSLYNYARLEESYYHSAINPERAIYGKHMDYDLLKEASVAEAAEYLKEGLLVHNPPHRQWNAQCFWLKDEDQKVDVDFIARFENIQDDIKEIMSAIGLQEKTDLPIINTSKSGSLHYRDVIDNETRKILEAYYAEDLQRFNYEF